jgi:DNA repair ATPase RecN
MADLTPDEAKFFETGELPASLQAPEPVEPAPAAPPEPAPAAAPAAAPNDDFLRQMLAEEQKRSQETLQRLQSLERQLAEKLNPPTPAPDPETDPLGNLMHQVSQVSGTVSDLQQRLTQEQQQKQLQDQFNAFTNSVRSIKDEYEKTVPDFKDAYNHIRAVRTEDLRTVGVPEADIPKVLLQDELNIAQAALQRGKNPAEEMYNMAKRYGYSAKGSIPAAQHIANLNKGAQAARSPAASAPATELTMESLKDASEGDLSRMVQDDALWAKLVGGTSHDIFGPH